MCQILRLHEIEHLKDHYLIGKKVLGQGCSSQVRQAIHKESGTECALKIIRKAEIEGQDYLQHLLENEIKVLQRIRHPNIVEIYELSHD